MRSDAWLALTAAAIGAWSLALSAQAYDPPSQPNSGAPAATQPKKTDPQDRKICRDDEQQTGSILTRRVCHTQREWDQIDQDRRSYINDNQHTSNFAPH